MGHLYAQGSISSESEREIQIGNLAAVDGSDFSAVFDYVALGHIHRPQLVGNKKIIRYSGSPIALSFSEKDDKKISIILETEANKITKIEEIEIPKFRHLKRISGNLETVKKKLIDFENTAQLKAFIEIEVNEENYNPLLIKEVNEIINISDDENAVVLKHRISFKNEIKSSDELFVEGENLEDISAKAILLKRLERENALSEEHQKLILDAFAELIEMVEKDDEN